MKPTPLRTRHWLSVGLCSALPLLLSCEPDNKVEPGAPQIVSFGAQDPQGGDVSPTDADGGVVEVTPRLHFTAIFDRLLDPSTLVSITDAGLVGKPGAVTIEAPGMPAVDLTYTPNGDAKLHLVAPPGPAVVAQPVPTLPSGATVTVRLNPALLLAKDGKTAAVLQMGVPQTLVFQTLAFTASITVPPPPEDGGVMIAGASDGDGGVADGGTNAGDVDGGVDAGDVDGGGAMRAPTGTFAPAPADFVVSIAFTNLPADDVASHIHVSAWDLAGQPIEPPMVAIAADGSDPATWTVAPAMGKTWAPGSVVSVTVDADAADPFGNKLGNAVTAAFAVAAQ